jgi:hypothetical protein
MLQGLAQEFVTLGVACRWPAAGTSEAVWLESAARLQEVTARLQSGDYEALARFMNEAIVRKQTHTQSYQFLAEFCDQTAALTQALYILQNPHVVYHNDR